MTETPNPARVSTGQIAELLAWARALSERCDEADAAERAAFHAAKADLLTRLDPDPRAPQGQTEGQR